ncbi:hypothetical protein DL98DRAFT_523358 [Cadophora sp. DSE1049]|nr:hypothetical protein DL98DRAFT_523358 [Cadophora sp. DSE1049]
MPCKFFEIDVKGLDLHGECMPFHGGFPPENREADKSYLAEQNMYTGRRKSFRFVQLSGHIMSP